MKKTKAELSKEIHASNLLRAKEIELCQSLWSDLVELEYALERIRVTLKFECTEPDSGKRVKTCMKEWDEALTKLRYGYEKARLFLPDRLYTMFHNVSSLQLSVVSEYSLQMSNRQHVVPSYESFLEGLEKDWKILDEIFEAAAMEIHERFEKLKE